MGDTYTRQGQRYWKTDGTNESTKIETFCGNTFGSSSLLPLLLLLLLLLLLFYQIGVMSVDTDFAHIEMFRLSSRTLTLNTMPNCIYSILKYNG